MQVALSGKTAGAVNRWFSEHGDLKLDGRIKQQTLETMRRSGVAPGQRNGLLNVLNDNSDPVTPSQILEFLGSPAALAGLLAQSRHETKSSTAKRPPSSPGARSPIQDPNDSYLRFDVAAKMKACEATPDLHPTPALPYPDPKPNANYDPFTLTHAMKA